MIRCALALTGVSLFAAMLAPAVAAQEQPTMLATSKYLFVLRGDLLYQYDVDTLQLRFRTRLPPVPPGFDDVGRGDTGKDGTARRFQSALSLGGGSGGKRRAAPRPAKPPHLAVKPKKVDKQTVRTGIDNALDWLAKHQDDDGRWDSDQFMKHDTDGAPCTGPGSAIHDIGATGLAMLAMLGDGSTLRSGPHKEHLTKAAMWLRKQQQDNGLFGTNASHDFIYDHAIATYAMCEAYGLSKYDLLKNCAQNGINYLESHRNPYSVWRYQPRDNDNDTSVTSWCLLACKAGEHFGLEVNKNALKLGLSWLDQVTSPDGRCGYTKQGEKSSRMPGDHAARFPIDKCETLTAAALFCRSFLGQSPKTQPVMLASANRLLKKPPHWSVEAGTIDHYYWYYGTYAMYQIGGKHWQRWRAHMLPAVTDNQQQQGNAKGSWDPVGVWGETGGRVCSTALMTLTLQANYRYSRLVK